MRLAAIDLVVRKGGRAVLDRVCLDAEGGFVAVVGPNGAGKSTMLRCLAGLAKPDSGSVRLDDVEVARIPLKALARRRAYLPQGARAEWPLPVERLVALGLTPSLPPFGELPEAMAARVRQALVDTDLAGQRLQPVTTLSGGELGRAMLARALVGDPEILIVDEPVAGLDARHALDCISRLRDLADGGKLVIAALHDLTLAVRYATRVVVLDKGRLAADGAPLEVLTPDLMRRVFEVEARVLGGAESPIVDVRAVAP